MISPWTIYKQDVLDSGKNKPKNITEKEKGRRKQQNNSILESIILKNIEMQSKKQTYQGQNGKNCGSLTDNIKRNAQNDNIQLTLKGSTPNQIQLDLGSPLQMRKKQRQVMNFKPNNKLNLIQPEEQTCSLSQSKDFLRNVLPQYQYNTVDNANLLDFCKNQKKMNIQNRVKKQHFVQRKKLINGQKLIQQQKQHVLGSINCIVLLSFIKASLKKEESLKKQTDDDITYVMKHLNSQLFPKINYEKELLQKLLRRQQQKMIKRQQQQQKLDQKIKQKRNLNCLPHSPKNKVLKKKVNHAAHAHFKQYKDDEVGNYKDLLSFLQQNIDKSTIIKYRSNNSGLSQTNTIQSCKKQKQSQKLNGDIQKSDNKQTSIVNNISSKITVVKHKQSVDKNDLFDQLPMEEVQESHQNNKKIVIYKKQSKENNQGPQNRQCERKPYFDKKETDGKNIIKKLLKQHVQNKQFKKEQKRLQQKNLKAKKDIIQYQRVKTNDKQFSHHINKLLGILSMKESESRLRSRPRPLSLYSPILASQLPLSSVSSVLSPANNLQLSTPTNQLLDMIMNRIMPYSQHSQSKQALKKHDNPTNNKSRVISQAQIKDNQMKEIRMRRIYSQVKTKSTKNEQNNKIKQILAAMNRQPDQIDRLFKSIKFQPYQKIKNQFQTPKSLGSLRLKIAQKQHRQQPSDDYNFQKINNSIEPLYSQLMTLLSCQNNQLANREYADYSQSISKEVSLTLNDQSYNGKNENTPNTSEMNTSLHQFNDHNMINHLKYQINQTKRIKKYLSVS